TLRVPGTRLPGAGEPGRACDPRRRLPDAVAGGRAGRAPCRAGIDTAARPPLAVRRPRQAADRRVRIAAAAGTVGDRRRPGDAGGAGLASLVPQARAAGVPARRDVSARCRWARGPASGAGAAGPLGRLLRQPPRVGPASRRPAPAPGVRMHRLGGVRRNDVRDLRGTADRAAGLLQPAARTDAPARRIAERAFLAALGLNAARRWALLAG